MRLSPLIDRLIDALTILPGVGPKSAQRMALHLLRHNRDGAEALAAEILGQSPAAYDEIAGTGAKQLRPGAVEVETLSAWAAGQADNPGRQRLRISEPHG